MTDHKKKNTTEVAGLIMPQSIEMEAALLGCLLVDTSVISKVNGIVSVDTFYKPAHQLVYESMLRLFKKNQNIDYLTVTEELKLMGKLDAAGGSMFVADLSNIMSAAYSETYAKKLEEKAIGRRILIANNEASSRIYKGEEDVFDIIRDQNDAIFKAQSALNSYKNVTPAYVGDLLVKQMREGMLYDGMTGVPFGVPEIDARTGGKQAGQLIGIGARTRHGKTALAAGFMFNSTKIINENFGTYPSIKCKSKYPAAFFSMEMINTELFARLVSMQIEETFDRKISYSRISRGMVDEYEAGLVEKATELLAERGIYIDDTPALNTMTLKTKVMKYIMEYGIEEVYIDFIQLFSNGDNRSKENRAQQLSEWTTEIKNMAKLFRIPITILSQVDRSTEKTTATARPPVLADLKDSGGLEERCDVVLLGYRWDVNDPNATDEMGRSLAGVIQINIAKQKQGGGGIIQLPFDVATNTFGSVQDFEQQTPPDWRPKQTQTKAEPFSPAKYIKKNTSSASDDIQDESPF
jgi:replicative DNA helicase